MTCKPYKPTAIDINIGKTIQILRAKQGLSQSRLASMVGVTFQQFQKYETAGNRISASRLYQIAQALQVPVAALYNEAVTAITLYDKDMLDLIHRMHKLSTYDKALVRQFIYRLGQ